MNKTFQLNYKSNIIIAAQDRTQLKTLIVICDKDLNTLNTLTFDGLVAEEDIVSVLKEGGCLN